MAELKTYRATRTSLCPCCDRGIRKGMPIHYVRPLAYAGWDTYSHMRSVAIHASCARLYEVEAS